MSYDLKSIRVPKLAGIALKTFVNLLENGYSRKLLESPLLKEAGVNRLRAYSPALPPSPQPKHAKGRSLSQQSAQDSIKEASDGLKKHHKFERPWRTVQDIAAAYRSFETTPETVAEQVILSIAESNLGNEPIQAIINTNEQDIRRQAMEAGERIRQGNARGLLDGIPVVIKDEIDAIPYATSVGTQVYGQTSSAVDDGTVVARLRAAGAIIIGKANMHEIGIGVTGGNPHFGVCRNPYNVHRHTGGSSSGSAAAVAAGLCPLAVGADGGGSIRIPAALCGVVGLKATWGRISEHGAAPLCWSVAHVGPIGSCVDDVALAYSIMAGPDTKDPQSLEQPSVHLKDYLNSNLKGLRVGIFTPWFKHAEPAIVDACMDALRTLELQGATRHEITIAEMDLQRIAHAVTISSEMLTAVGAEFKKDMTQFAMDTRLNLALAGQFSSTDYVKAQQIRTLAINEFMKAFADVDVIITPSTGITAPSINEKALPVGESNLSALTEIMRFATAGNLTGLPAISVPAGYDKQGLPIGVQLMGRPWEEHLLLRMARVIESEVELQTPPLCFDLLG